MNRMQTEPYHPQAFGRVEADASCAFDKNLRYTSPYFHVSIKFYDPKTRITHARDAKTYSY